MRFVLSRETLHAGKSIVAVTLALNFLMPFSAFPIDSNGDNLSDVFANMYGKDGDGGLDPFSDHDGDGFNALQEYFFGGNPFVYGDLDDLFELLVSKDGLSIKLEGKPFRRYEIRYSDDLKNWSKLENVSITLGKNRESHDVSLPFASGGRFYVVQGLEPVDLDGDLLNDWEEMVLGSNPNSVDTDGNGMPDGLQYQTVLDPNPYHVVLEDSFDGNELDRKIWRIITGGTGWGNKEEQYFRRENIEVSNGTLKIVAKKEDYGGRKWTAGRISSAGLQSFKYGKVEARIKVPVGAGLWPAFWMLGDPFYTNGWPICGEIDVMETGHGDQLETEFEGRVVYCTTHRALSNGIKHKYHGSNYTSETSLGDDFHIYGVEWTPRSITGYIDGKEYYYLDISDDSEEESIEEFHEHFYLILNLAVAGYFTGIWEGNEKNPGGRGLDEITSEFPATMEVDWVRVSQRWPDSIRVDDGTRNFPPSSGIFVVYRETYPNTNRAGLLTYDVNASVFDWNRVVNPLQNLSGKDPLEGLDSLAFLGVPVEKPPSDPDAWTGVGFGIHSAYPRNLAAYDWLHFALKTDSDEPFKIGIESGLGDVRGGSWIFFKKGSDPYGFKRDGKWHQIRIPLSRFKNTDLKELTLFFGLATEPLLGPFEFEIDDVYYIDDDEYGDPVPDPVEYNDFAVYDETVGYRSSFLYGQDGNLNNWTLGSLQILNLPIDQTVEGFEALNLKVKAGKWFGMGIDHDTGLDLRRYSDDFLRVSLKTTSDAPFKIGIKSGKYTGAGLRNGESWVYFREGEESYGFKRDGRWHHLAIPLKDFPRVNFRDVTQVFMLAGEAYHEDFEIHVDSVYWEDRDSLNSLVPEQQVHANYLVFSDETGGSDEYRFDVDGRFYQRGSGNWTKVNTLIDDGCDGLKAWRFSFQANNWFWGGVSFTTPRNFPSYNNGSLHLAMRCSDSSPFKIGIKTGYGESWIHFPDNDARYGFKRDGEWHKISIPFSRFTDESLEAVQYLFMIARDPESGNSILDIDDVYWSRN